MNSYILMSVHKMSKCYFFITSILCLSFLNCSTSPLSDVEITDPSLISISANLFYYENNTQKKDSMIVVLSDKNGATLSLKNGGCFVNNTKMKCRVNSYFIDYFISDSELQG